jgi:hypothetical protein
MPMKFSSVYTVIINMKADHYKALYMFCVLVKEPGFLVYVLPDMHILCLSMLYLDNTNF